MKCIIAVAMFLLTFVMAPSGFAQVTYLITSIVVGNDTPGMPPGFFIASNRLAQQFSLSSPTYISRVDLALLGDSEEALTGTCTFSVAITQSLGPDASYAPPVLQRSESATGIGAFQLSDTFPTILLHAGTYFLVVDGTTGTNPCNLLGWHLAKRFF